MTQNGINIKPVNTEILSGTAGQTLPLPSLSPNYMMLTDLGNGSVNPQFGIPQEWGVKNLLSSQTANNSSQLVFNNFGGYNYLLLEFLYLKPAADNGVIGIQLSANNGSTYQNQYNNFGVQAATYRQTDQACFGAGANGQIGYAYMLPSAGLPNGAYWSGADNLGGMSGFYKLYMQVGKIVWMQSKVMYTSVQPNVSYCYAYAEGHANNGLTSTIPAGVVNNFKIVSSVGNLATGTVRLFGVK